MKDKAIPRFFETPAAMRSWLAKNHLKANELHVGYVKRRCPRRNVQHDLAAIRRRGALLRMDRWHSQNN